MHGKKIERGCKSAALAKRYGHKIESALGTAFGRPTQPHEAGLSASFPERGANPPLPESEAVMGEDDSSAQRVMRLSQPAPSCLTGAFRARHLSIHTLLQSPLKRNLKQVKSFAAMRGQRLYFAHA
jgi:hypothetical protein